MSGKLRVGTIKYDSKRRKVFPPSTFIEDGKEVKYERVEVMTYSCKKWFELSPYSLTDEKGRNMENLWQFSKVYPKVPAVRNTYSRFNPTVIWQHPAETHVDAKGNLTEEYQAWRKKGMENKYPVRYPVGFSREARASCLYSMDEDGKKYDYVGARENIYLKLYSRLVKEEKKYQKLKKKWRSGTNLLIVEVDGPRQESLEHYRKNYDVPDDFIVNNTMIANRENLTVMLNDTKHPFGHGYCLALTLLTDTD